MRATVGTQMRRTIDLTSSAPRVQMVPQLRATRAQEAFRSSRRARTARGLVDTVADAIMATGGILLANVSLDLKLGLPQGIGGIAMGVAMLGLGAAIALARRTRSAVDPDPATAMLVPRVIVLDEPPTVITLDPVSTAARSAAARRRAAA